MADVYTGDDDQGPTAANRAAPVHVLIVIEADPDPDALCRITGITSLGNCAPFAGQMTTMPDGNLAITLEFLAVSSSTLDLIRRKLAQLTCVTKVQIQHSVDKMADWTVTRE